MYEDWDNFEGEPVDPQIMHELLLDAIKTINEMLGDDQDD